MMMSAHQRRSGAGRTLETYETTVIYSKTWPRHKQVPGSNTRLPFAQRRELPNCVSLRPRIPASALSMTTPAPEPGHPRPRPQRILACILCQQRKVKCGRRFPCANCVRYQVRCVPATQTRPRRRRFPERELLDRLRMYEDLLHQNRVKFKPLHKDPASGGRGCHQDSCNSDPEQQEAAGVDTTPCPSTTVRPKSCPSLPIKFMSMTTSVPEISGRPCLRG